MGNTSAKSHKNSPTIPVRDVPQVSPRPGTNPQSSVHRNPVIQKVSEYLDKQKLLDNINITSENELEEIINLILWKAKEDPHFAALFCEKFIEKSFKEVKELSVTIEGFLLAKCLMECEDINPEKHDAIKNHPYASFNLLRFIGLLCKRKVTHMRLIVNVLDFLPQRDERFFIECSCILMDFAQEMPLYGVAKRKVIAHLDKLKQIDNLMQLGYEEKINGYTQIILQRKQDSIEESAESAKSEITEDVDSTKTCEPNAKVVEESVSDSIDPDKQNDTPVPISNEDLEDGCPAENIYTENIQSTMLTEDSKPTAECDVDHLEEGSGSSVLSQAYVNKQMKLQQLNAVWPADTAFMENLQSVTSNLDNARTTYDVEHIEEGSGSSILSQVYVNQHMKKLDDVWPADTAFTANLQSVMSSLDNRPTAQCDADHLEEGNGGETSKLMQVEEIEDSRSSDEYSPSLHHEENVEESNGFLEFLLDDKMEGNQLEVDNGGVKSGHLSDVHASSSHDEIFLPIQDTDHRKDCVSVDATCQQKDGLSISEREIEESFRAESLEEHRKFDEEKFIPIYNIAGKKVVTLQKDTSEFVDSSLQEVIITLGIVYSLIGRFGKKKSLKLELLAQFYDTLKLKQKGVLKKYGNNLSASFFALVLDFPNVFKKKNEMIHFSLDGLMWSNMYMENILAAGILDIVRNRNVTLTDVVVYLREVCSVEHFPFGVILTPMLLRQFIETHCSEVSISDDETLRLSANMEQLSINTNSDPSAKYCLKSCVGKVIHVTKAIVIILWSASFTGNVCAQVSMLVSANVNSLHSSLKGNLSNIFKAGDIVAFSVELLCNSKRNIIVLLNDLRFEFSDRFCSSCHEKSRGFDAKCSIPDFKGLLFWNCNGIVVSVEKTFAYICCPAEGVVPLKFIAKVRKDNSWIAGERELGGPNNIQELLKVGDVVVCHIEGVINALQALVWQARCVKKTGAAVSFSGSAKDEVMGFLKGKNIEFISFFGRSEVFLQRDLTQMTRGNANLMWNMNGYVLRSGVIALQWKEGQFAIAEISPACWNPECIDLSVKSAEVRADAQFDEIAKKLFVYCLRTAQHSVKRTDNHKSCVCLPKVPFLLPSTATTQKKNVCPAHRKLDSKEEIVTLCKGMSKLKVHNCTGEVVRISDKWITLWWSLSQHPSVVFKMLVSVSLQNLRDSCKSKYNLPETFYLNVGDMVTFSTVLIPAEEQWSWLIKNVQKDNSLINADADCVGRSKMVEMIKTLSESNKPPFLLDCLGCVVSLNKHVGTLWCPNANEDISVGMFVHVKKSATWVAGGSPDFSTDLTSLLSPGDVVLCNVELVETKTRDIKWLARCVRKYTTISLSKKKGLSGFEQMLRSKSVLNHDVRTARHILQDKVKHGAYPYWDPEKSVPDGCVLWNVEGIIGKNCVNITTKHNATISATISPSCWNPYGIDVTKQSEKIIVCAVAQVSATIITWTVNFISKPVKSTNGMSSEKSVKPVEKKTRHSDEMCTGEVLYVGKKSAAIRWSSWKSIEVNALVNARSFYCEGVINVLNVGDLVNFHAHLENELGLLNWVLRDVTITTKQPTDKHNDHSQVTRIVEDLTHGEKVILWKVYGVVVFVGNEVAIWCPRGGSQNFHILVYSSPKSDWVTDGNITTGSLKCGQVVVCGIENRLSRSGCINWRARYIRKLNKTLSQSTTDIWNLVYEATINKKSVLTSLIKNAKRDLASSEKDPVFGESVMLNVTGEVLNANSIKLTTKTGGVVTAHFKEGQKGTWNPDNIQLNETTGSVVASAELVENNGQPQWIVRWIRKLGYKCWSISTEAGGPSGSKVDIVVEGSQTEKSPEISGNGNLAGITAVPGMLQDLKNELCYGQVFIVSKESALIWWSSRISSGPTSILVSCDANSMDKTVDRKYTSLHDLLKVGDHVQFRIELDHVQFYIALEELGVNSGLLRWQLRDVSVIKTNPVISVDYSLQSRMWGIVGDIQLGNRKPVFWNCYGIVGLVREKFASIWCLSCLDLPHHLIVDVYIHSEKSWILSEDGSPGTLECGNVVICDVEGIYCPSGAMRWLARCVRKLKSLPLKISDFKGLVLDAVTNNENGLNSILDTTIRDRKTFSPRTDQVILEETGIMNVLKYFLHEKHVEFTTKEDRSITAVVPVICWDPDGLDFTETPQKVTVYGEFLEDRSLRVRCIRKPSTTTSITTRIT